MTKGRVLCTYPRFVSGTNRHTRTRFAPSPTGPLHIGGLRTALVNYLQARKDGGHFILRIEDTDQSRCSLDYRQRILNGLQWSGLKIDEGPDTGGLYGPYIQSERLKIYHKFTNHLLKIGRAYRCFCSHDRLEILKHEQRRRGETVRYDNRCRHLSNKEIETRISQNLPYTIRFRLHPDGVTFYDVIFGEVKFPNVASEGDPVIIKSDGMPVYHLANVVDDHLMEISHVIRGSEWLTSVPKHLQLYSAFGWEPPVFAHLPLMLSSSGRKFSKRAVGEEASLALVGNLRRQGRLPAAVLTWLSATGGLFDFSPIHRNSNAAFSGVWRPGNRVEEMIGSFDLSSLSHHHARVDSNLLEICGRAHFDRLIDEALNDSSTEPVIVKYLREYLASCDASNTSTDHLKIWLSEPNKLLAILARLKGRISCLSDLTSTSGFSFLWVAPSQDALNTFLGSTESDKIRRALLKAASSLEKSKWLSGDELKTIFKSSSGLSGLPKAKFLKLLRTSLTGSEIGMPVDELVLLLSPEEAAKRIRSASLCLC